MRPPQYTFDAARLTTLDAFGILDTPAEPGFDSIVELAAQICETPVALVSLVSSDRQWFKARIGFEGCETDLNSSVCAFALVEPDLLIVPDLSKDPRTSANPLVTGEPGIRFYAGAPLKTAEGVVLGSLCVIDSVPRPQGLTPQQAAGLRHLGRQVMAQLELHRAVAERNGAIQRQTAIELERRLSDTLYRTLFQALDAGFCIIELKFADGVAVDYRFVDLNPAFVKHTGLFDAKGKWMRELAPEHEQHWFDLYGRVALTGEAIRFEQGAKQLGDRWFDVQAFRIGESHRVGVLFNDVSDKREAERIRQLAEESQDVLNKELSHRMKNTFAMVHAIATQTLRKIPDKQPVNAFLDRLHALSTAHEVLLKQNWSAADIGAVLHATIQTLSQPERFQASGPPVNLSDRATLSIALLLHELMANALKHGSLSNDTGQVNIEWKVTGSASDAELLLHWRESGGPPAQEPAHRGFGSRLIQLGFGTGTSELRYKPSGFEAEFRAPLAQVLSSQGSGSTT